jgi:acyl carrier protein
MPFPTLDEAIETIRTIADIEDVHADMRIEELDVDSIDLLEWLYELETTIGMQLDESLFNELTPAATLREVYALTREYVEAESKKAVAGQ